MPYFTYDTSVIISRRFIDLRNKTKGLHLSSIVLLELTASAADDSMRKRTKLCFEITKKISL